VINPYSLLLDIIFLDVARTVYVSMTSAILTSTVLTALSEKQESREDKEMEKLVAKALLLPYNIKSMKLEGNKIIIEIEGEESEQSED
jgi:hypothetical protein